MPAFPAPRPSTPAFKAWVWLLLCAVLLQSGAGAVVQVLGRAHTHHAVEAAPASGWVDAVLAWRAARIQALQASGVFKHASVDASAHHHDGLERHHHGPGDASVQAMDSASHDATADTGQANAANPAAAWGPTAEHRAAPAAQGPSAWPRSAAPAWTSALTRLPERPPRG